MFFFFIFNSCQKGNTSFQMSTFQYKTNEQLLMLHLWLMDAARCHQINFSHWLKPTLKYFIYWQKSDIYFKVLSSLARDSRWQATSYMFVQLSRDYFLTMFSVFIWPILFLALSLITDETQGKFSASFVHTRPFFFWVCLCYNLFSWYQNTLFWKESVRKAIPFQVVYVTMCFANKKLKKSLFSL